MTLPESRRSEVDDRALACAADALFRHDYPESVTEEWRRKHGYPAPIFGPTRNQAQVVIEAYLDALDGGRP